METFECYCGKKWVKKESMMDHIASEATRVDFRTDDRTHMSVKEPAKK